MTEIVLVADEHYLPYIPCNLAQIGRFARRATGVTLVTPKNADETHLTSIKKTACLHEIQFTRVEICVEEQRHRGIFHDGGQTARHVSHFTFAKLLLADHLSHLDEILYLDVDTVIRAPIDDLLDWSLSHPIAAVEEFQSGRSVFETSRLPYFNAGVLRMSLERLRKECLSSTAIEFLKRNPSLPYQDQDVFNYIFSSRFDLLPSTFNVSDWVAAEYPRLFNVRNITILHFSGSNKPWNPITRSEFARDWRRDYGGFILKKINNGKPLSSRQSYGAVQLKSSVGWLRHLARNVLPKSLRQAARSCVLENLEEISVKSLELREKVENGFRSKQEMALQRLPEFIGDEWRYPVQVDPAGDRLDLIVSIARSGTNALASSIQRSRPEVSYMHELYLGSTLGLEEGELDHQYPWFKASRISPSNRLVDHCRKDFLTMMSENVVDVTRAVLAKRTGRVLIKVLPGQLHPSAFSALLHAFRPRLLILRRELIFSYVSILKAAESQSYQNFDNTNADFKMSNRHALDYCRTNHNFIDRAALLAERLGLISVAITYNGLFSSGEDVRALNEFYPGEAFPRDLETGVLISPQTVQDRRTDESLLAMIKGVYSLSAEAQSNLIRLPGLYLS